MKYLNDGTYSQSYFSTDFFMLQDVLEYEDERLCGLGVKCTDYEFSLGLENGEMMVFYLELFFISKNGSALKEEKLFKYKL